MANLTTSGKSRGGYDRNQPRHPGGSDRGGEWRDRASTHAKRMEEVRKLAAATKPPSKKKPKKATTRKKKPAASSTPAPKPRTGKLADTLSAWEGPRRSKPVEEGAIVSPSGKILKSLKGDATGVKLTESDYALMKGGAFTHNHPNDVSFSDADFRVFAFGGMDELRAVAKNHVYSLSMPQGKRKPSVDAVDRYWYQTHDKLIDEYKDKVYHQKSMTSAEMALALSHEIAQRVAKKFKIDYRREAL